MPKLAKILKDKKTSLGLTDEQFRYWIAESAQKRGVPAIDKGLIPSIGALQRWTDSTGEKDKLPNVYFFQVLAAALNMTMDELFNVVVNDDETGAMWASTDTASLTDFEMGRTVQLLLTQKPEVQKEVLTLLINNLLK